MPGIAARLTRYFTEPILPSASVLISRSYLAGVQALRKECRIAGHFIRRLPAGLVEPSFDRRNIADPAAAEAALREGLKKLGSADGPLSLLLPEPCARVFILTFDKLPASNEERVSLVRWRIQKLLPLKPEDLRISFDAQPSNGQARVVAALARVTVLREYEDLVGRCGRRIGHIGLPSLGLLGLVRPENGGDALVLNLEDDHMSLTVLLNGEVTLYRHKSFGPEPQPASALWAAAAAEAETTAHALEDREHKKDVREASDLEGESDEGEEHGREHPQRDGGGRGPDRFHIAVRDHVFGDEKGAEERSHDEVQAEGVRQERESQCDEEREGKRGFLRQKMP